MGSLSGFDKSHKQKIINKTLVSPVSSDLMHGHVTKHPIPGEHTRFYSTYGSSVNNDN
jgi:hypothetical protein